MKFLVIYRRAGVVEQSEVRAGVPVVEATRNNYYGDAATPSGLWGKATQAGLPVRRDDPTTSSRLRGCVRNRGQAGLSLLSIRWTIAI